MNQYASISIKNPPKIRCGDYSYAGTLPALSKEGSAENPASGVLWFAAVADGVSRAPKDWLASRTAIETILEYFSATSTDLLSSMYQDQVPHHPPIRKNYLPAIEERLRAAILAAHDKILSGVDDTFGMLCTLSAVIYVPATGETLLSNIGDSRIYGLREDSWELLTQDDSKTSLLKTQGKLLLHDGQAARKSVLTKAIGHPELSEIRITILPEGLYQALALASDGLYDLPGFSTMLSAAIEVPDMQSVLDALPERIAGSMRDDASLALLRLPRTAHQPPIDLEQILTSSTSENLPSTATLMDILEPEIKKAVLDGNSTYLTLLLDLMERKRLFYPKPQMVALLDFMIEHQQPLSHRLVSMIRRI